MKTKERKSKVNKESASLKPVDMLKEDHQKVKAIFKQFEEAEDEAEKEELVSKAIEELKIHAAVEEEVFYPAARQKLKGEEGEDLMDEAVEEHHVVKLLIEELENMRPSDDRYDAKFTVLAENVKHHIEEEEGEMFPKIKNSPANSQEIGEKMFRRKQELQEEAAEL